MGLRGPAPKDGAIRRNKKADPEVIEVSESSQPALPGKFVLYRDKETGKLVWRPFPAVTKALWREFAESPLSDGFSALDWQMLLPAMIAHARFLMLGSAAQLAQFQSIAGKFGLTPKDRQAINVKTVKQGSAKQSSKSSVDGSGAREEFGGLRAV